jgi:pimeloyl-ACP methyl ester carboxylesterase
MREHTFDAHGVVINYAEGASSGPPLLFLHGFTFHWRHIRSVLPFFTPEWHVFASDMRGHGKSGRAERYRLVDYAVDSIALLREQIGEPAVLVGTSLGANVAAVIAWTAPELVQAIILEDPTIFNYPPSETEELATWEELRRLLDDISELAAIIRADRSLVALRRAVALRNPNNHEVALRSRALHLHRLDPRAIDEAVTGGDLDGYEPDFGAITCPVLLLRADPSVGSLCSDRGLKTAREQIADLTVVEMSGAGHVIRATHPLEFVRRTTTFLDTI